MKKQKRKYKVLTRDNTGESNVIFKPGKTYTAFKMLTKGGWDDIASFIVSDLQVCLARKNKTDKIVECTVYGRAKKEYNNQSSYKKIKIEKELSDKDLIDLINQESKLYKHNTINEIKSLFNGAGHTKRLARSDIKLITKGIDYLIAASNLQYINYINAADGRSKYLHTLAKNRVDEILSKEIKKHPKLKDAYKSFLYIFMYNLVYKDKSNKYIKELWQKNLIPVKINDDKWLIYTGEKCDLVAEYSKEFTFKNLF